MSGVIGSDGIQWERCNHCGGWEKIDELRYEQPSEKYDCGRDICRKCAKLLGITKRGLVAYVRR